MTFRKSNFIFMFIFLLFCSILIILNSPISQTISTPDSISYRYVNSSEQINPYLGNYDLQILSRIDFLGNALRPWPFNLILHLIGTDRLISAFFIILTALSWTFLCYSLLKFLDTTWYLKILWVLIFIFFLTSPQIYTWNDFILSESFVNSLSLIFIAIFILIYMRLTKLTKSRIINFQLLLLCLLYLILAVSRPTLGISLTILMFILILKFYRNKSNIKYLVGTFILITQMYVGLISYNSSNYWERVLGTPISGTTFSHLSDMRNQNSQKFINYALERGAPNCLINYDFENSYPWDFSRTYATNCISGIKWLNSDFPRIYSNYLASGTNFNDLILNELSVSFQGDDYFKYYSEHKSFKPLILVNNFIWNNVNFYFTLKIFSVFLFTLLLIFSIKCKSKYFNRLIPVNSIIVIFSIIGLLNVILTRILMPDDFGRLGYPGSIYFNLFSLILIVNTLDKLILNPAWNYLLNVSFVKV